ncbi:MAG: hypothetical protein V3U17_00680 [Thermoplasmata archaeon]
MRVFYQKGIRVHQNGRELMLDPRSRQPHAIVSHAHMDHLAPGAYMTPETLDVMKVRMGKKADGTALPYHQEVEVEGMNVSLSEAGHVFGSAMIRVDDLLFTGDFNPSGGPTCGTCEPQDCETLVIESTYGKPRFAFPPKEEVLRDLLSWMEDSLETGPVALGAYEFGKGQELVALANELDVPVLVPNKMALIAEVYRKHGHPLRFTPYAQAQQEKEGPYVLLAPSRAFKRPGSAEVQEVLEKGGRTAFTSGWCSVYDFRRSHHLDAQFPLSDHGDIDDLMWFVDACNPKEVYTCLGYDEELAKTIRIKLRTKAEPLGKGWF